jgi:hypothetical protein
LEVSPLNTSRAVIDTATGRPLQVLQLFSELVSKLPILIGTGSPEGVIEAKQTRLYMDDAGGVGTILYIKKTNDIAGNRKNGWILV